MRARHTPGPWTVEWPEDDSVLALTEGPIVRGAEGHLVAEVLSLGLDESSGHADARLIAAAPDLLEALLRVEAKQGANIMGEPLCPLHGPDCARGERYPCVFFSAIAKATGEEAPHG